MSEGADKPISVKATAAPVVISESTKAILLGGFALAADHFMHSESAIIAVLAAAGFMLTGLWGLWHRLRTWGALRFLADKVDDAVAIVGGRK